MRFDKASQTISGKPARIFLSNELTEDSYNKQVECQKLLCWLETAEPREFTAMAELIVEKAGSEYKVLRYPGLEKLNLRPIQIEIRKLSVPALRELNSLIDGGRAAESQIAA